MVDRITEQNISTSPEPISLKQTEKIIEQMKNNSICRINNHGKGTGFFVNIPYKSKFLPVLITTNHAINQDDIQNNKIISLYLNNGKMSIKLDNNRLRYTNEKLDTTIIEIKENDHNLNEKERPNYLDNLNNIYLDESLYLLNYSKDKDIFVSYGKLLYIKNSDIMHNCNIKEGSSNSHILLINNQKLIGIHRNISKINKYNKGILLIYSIIEFSKIKKNFFIINKEGKNMIYQQLDNFIIDEFDIKEDEQDIRIINSYEESNRDSCYIEKNMKVKKK